ncbi:MAG TPA: hypothetical protein VI911_10935 [Patescibacteria group bacterium]|nr:hypothetical protein [Patescibacteria group bacterium]
MSKAPIITATPQKVTLPTGAKVIPVEGSKLGSGEGNNGRGGGYEHMKSRWKELKIENPRQGE